MDRKHASIDPRTGLFLLIVANVIAFTQDRFEVEIGWIAALIIFTMLCGCVQSGIKWAAGYCLLLVFQYFVLPIAPKIVVSCFAIFCNYSRKMFPCLMVGSLMLKTLSLRELIAGLRKLHVSEKLIIPISVTLRYFPAIKEETGYICDAMKLRNIKGLEKVEALMIPLMISATQTAEELAAAAVTRGIENPVRKSSVVRLKMLPLDYGVFLVSMVFLAATFML